MHRCASINLSCHSTDCNKKTTTVIKIHRCLTVTCCGDLNAAYDYFSCSYFLLMYKQLIFFLGSRKIRFLLIRLRCFYTQCITGMASPFRGYILVNCLSVFIYNKRPLVFYSFQELCAFRPTESNDVE